MSIIVRERNYHFGNYSQEAAILTTVCMVVWEASIFLLWQVDIHHLSTMPRFAIFQGDISHQASLKHIYGMAWFAIFQGDIYHYKFSGKCFPSWTCETQLWKALPFFREIFLIMDPGNTTVMFYHFSVKYFPLWICEN